MGTLALTAFLFTGCMVGPKFKSPTVEMPEAYANAAEPAADSTEILKWWAIFDDPALVSLIDTALVNNRNVGIAMSRIEQARLSLRAVRADLYPSLGYGISGDYGTKTPLGVRPDKPVAGYEIGPSISWELDFFGKVRSAAEASRNELLASDYGMRATLISLIGDVATGYFTLLDYENSLQIAIRTLASRTESLKLMQTSFDAGVISGLDLKQAEIQQATAAAAVPQYERAVRQTRHALAILIGRNPETPIVTPVPLLSQSIPAAIPVGLPSEILKRRPDIMVAYHNLAAQNAQIGVAEAMRYPSIALTGSGGLISNEVKSLFTAGSFMWSAAASITGPIFAFGKNKRNVEIQKAKYDEVQLTYENTVLQALREVEDALVGVSTYRSQMAEYSILVASSADSKSLAMSRYVAGLTGYLDVLDADRTLFDAELQYSQIVRERLNAFVTLYKVLGGGWVNEADMVAR